MDKYIKLKIEAIVNKKLYQEKIIDKITYDKVAKRIDKLLFELRKGKRVKMTIYEMKNFFANRKNNF